MVINKWRGYNTPKPSDFRVTPLYGTGFYNQLLDLSSSLWINTPIGFYVQWLLVWYMLRVEYSDLYRAKGYLDNLNWNNLDSSYKNSFLYWRNRQFHMHYTGGDHLFENKHYIVDYTYYNNIYLEICEDFLYVILNLELAIIIIDAFNKTDFSKIDSKKFYLKVKSIVKNHYLVNKTGYNVLKDLRKYSVNHHSIVQQLNDICKNYTK